MATGDQEEVYTLLLTDIDKGAVDDDIVKGYYHDHLLRSEIGKVISVDFDQTKTSAIVKVKVKATTAASLLEEIQGNLKKRGRVETLHCLYSETFTLTLNWNASMKSVASGIIPYAKEHYPAIVSNGAEGVQTTISGTVHDVLSIQHQYNRHMAKSLCSHVLDPNASVSSPGVAASSESTASNIKEYGNLNPDVLALLEKLPEGKIPGVHYNTKGCCIVLDNCTSEEESVRISMFQTKYHELTYKMKVDAVVIPDELSDHAVKEMISKFDVKYSQCVFVVQEDPRAVRVISKSSRQFEQAKKILQDDLKQASNEREISATSGTLSEFMTIPIAGGRKLTLKKANIVLEEVDIIVNAANGSLEHGAGVAGAINRASNGEVQKHSHRYIKKNGQLFAGQVAVTKAGGSLKCKQIIHAVGPTKSDSNPSVCERRLREVMKKVLEQAQKNDAQSISIPAISAGIFGVGADLVAKSIVESILCFKFRKSVPVLSDIRIVIIDQPTHRSFAQLFAAKMPSFATTNTSPEPTHRSLSQPLSSSFVTTSPALSSTSYGLLSTNKTLSSTNEAPFSSSSELSSASNTLTSPKRTPTSSHSMIIVGVTNARPSISMAPVWPSTNSTSIAASSPSTNIVSWPSTNTVTPSLPPTEMLGVVPSSSSTTTVAPGSWTSSSAVASSSPLTSTVGIALSNPSTNSAPPFADGAPLSLPTVSCESYSSPLASSAGAPLSLPVADSVTASSNVAFPHTGKVSVTGSGKSSGLSTEDEMKLSLGKDAPIIRPLLQHLSEKWYILGTLLGFDQDALKKIASVAGSAESYLEQVITMWLCGDSAKPPTLESLIAALRDAAVGGGEVITRLLKAYNANNENVASVELIREPIGCNVNEQIILPYLPMISHKWRVIGILLGVGHQDLANIYGEPEECIRNVISLWLSGRCSTRPTVESFVNALRNRSVNEDDVAKAIEQDLLKMICKKDEDGSGIQYPSMSPFDGKGTDKESTGKNRRPTTPPPGFSGHSTSGAAPLVRSLSDSNSPPPPSTVTSRGEEKSSYRTADSHLTAATAGVRVNPQLATAYDLNIEHGIEDKMEIMGSARSDHKRRSSQSKMHHGDKRSSKAKCVTNPTEPETTETCVVCLEDFKNPVITKCEHKFCEECILKSLDSSPYCPICKVVLRPLIGNQPPNGKMNIEIVGSSLPGYEGYKTYKITYIIPSGTQGQNHPNPGMRYTGVTRFAYLPVTHEGHEVLMLLQKAFQARLIFTVGQSVTTGTDNTVVWNDIHHKTNPRYPGGPYGYPDATYLQRVKEDLAAKGIVPEYSTSTV